MENFRFKALEIAISRLPQKIDLPKEKISDYFGQMTFSRIAMREFLSEEAYEKVISAIEKGEKIERKIADQIAASLKAWATSKGATHYTHWFQPLTGSTAEKHEAFFSPIERGKPIENFQGSQLIQQEPDASSFPSGGLRNTFEARGYTAWDPTSPAFILDNTLCIPSIFVSYTGEALDFKTPLLKSITAIDQATVAVCKYFSQNITKVYPALGWEQEYFLVDTALYNARPDLVLTGRTLFGHASAKDQQLADHYFGVIPERIIAFMKDFEIEAYKIGIPMKTRHNEVAPNQFECAPFYEEVNLSVDHNQLIMHLLERVAKRHHLTVLLHEKPYAGINGSGKHCNWSLLTNTGENLFAPGKSAKTNLRFITFLVNTIRAVYEHADLLRATIASAGNDCRLGAHEAPPAIISIFIGSYLTEILKEIEKRGETSLLSTEAEMELDLHIPKIPEILLDNTDRNRTSPFAFTGNKFEFRAVGSSANCAPPMIVLNTILADQLVQFRNEVDRLIKSNVKKHQAILQVLRNYIIESKNILFEGNNYSDEWVEEAEKRGLSNIKATPYALKSFVSPKTISLFERNNIFTKKELLARQEIRFENYAKKLQIESRVIGDLATNHIIPTAIKYQNILIENVKGLKFLDKENAVLSEQNLSNPHSYLDISIKSLTDISMHISEIKKNVAEMIQERKKANKLVDAEEKAIAYYKYVLPYFEIIREHVDKLELMIDDELWPLPKYRELLFTK